MEHARIIGAPVTAAALEDFAEAVIARAGRGAYVCVANVHMVTLARRDAALAAAMEGAALVAADGMPLVWGLRGRGLAAERVAGPDLMPRLCALAAAAGIGVYLFGGSAETLAALRAVLPALAPGLRIAGAEAPRVAMPPAFDPGAAERIRRSGAGLVLVGLGCPKQELWMAAHTAAVPAVMVGVGAAFDMLAGRLRRAPLWMRRAGLEWLYRLAAEPRRLARRYLVSNTRFLWYLATEPLRRRRPQPASPDSTYQA